MNGTAVTNRLQNLFKITCTVYRIIEILGLRPSNRLPVLYYDNRCYLTWDEVQYIFLNNNMRQVLPVVPAKHNPHYLIKDEVLIMVGCPIFPSIY